MTRNVELLQQTMQHILDHPESHDQGWWMNDCGTVGCFAGWALILSGRKDIYHWGMEALKVLGLTESEATLLFGATNTRPMLELMVKDLVNGSELRQFSEYRTEARS